MESGVDDGDIIDQEVLSINKDDNIRTMIEKTAKASKKIILNSITKNKIDYKPQEKSKIKVFPQRSPDDGEIDWTWNINRIKDFVRAQTKPYPGAWTIINNKKVILWDISIEE